MDVRSGAPWQTTRLEIRKVRLEDAQAVFDSYASDPQVTRYLTWPTHTSIADSVGFLTRSLAEWDRPDGVRTFSICLRADDRLIGTIGYTVRGTTAEVGYVLGRAYWNMGYMSEVVSALVPTLLKEPDIFRVQAFHDIDNPASGRVMEKAGMTFEGVLHRYSIHPAISSEPRDVKLYTFFR